jgi:hypothetical protein
MRCMFTKRDTAGVVAECLREENHDGRHVMTKSHTETGDAALEARAALQELIRARAPHGALCVAADRYRDAIRAHGKATGRKLPVPSRAMIIRFLA